MDNLSGDEIRGNLVKLLFDLIKLARTDEAKKYSSKLVHRYTITEFLVKCEICGIISHRCPENRTHCIKCVFDKLNTN